MLKAHWLTDQEIQTMQEVGERWGTVIQYDIGWVWWDETQTYAFGPYRSLKEAEKAQAEYAETL